MNVVSYMIHDMQCENKKEYCYVCFQILSINPLTFSNRVTGLDTAERDVVFHVSCFGKHELIADTDTTRFGIVRIDKRQPCRGYCKSV